MDWAILANFKLQDIAQSALQLLSCPQSIIALFNKDIFISGRNFGQYQQPYLNCRASIAHLNSHSADLSGGLWPGLSPSLHRHLVLITGSDKARLQK